MKKERKKILIITLIVIVLLVGAYFGYRAYYNMRADRNLYIFEQGMEYGYTQAILQVINISYNCEPFPVYAGNESRELISVDCLS